MTGTALEGTLAWFWFGLAIVAGLVFGSFASVLVTRIPEKKKISGRSQCFECKSTLGWFENLPVLSFLLQKGRCRTCHASLPRLYPVLELSMAALFIAPFLLFHSWLQIITWIAFSVLGLPLAVIDVRHHRLPDTLTRALLILVILIAALYSWINHDFTRLWPATIGLFSLTIFYLTVAVISRGGMGMGDVKLAAPIGWTSGYFGLNTTLNSSFAAFLMGSLVGVGLMIFGKADRKSAIPFGPFMLAGQLIGIATISWRLI